MSKLYNHVTQYIIRSWGYHLKALTVWSRNLDRNPSSVRRLLQHTVGLHFYTVSTISCASTNTHRPRMCVLLKTTLTIWKVQRRTTPMSITSSGWSYVSRFRKFLYLQSHFVMFWLTKKLFNTLCKHHRDSRKIIVQASLAVPNWQQSIFRAIFQ